ncbi:hypothetical protein [Caulobacter sp. LARHSG274]
MKFAVTASATRFSSRKQPAALSYNHSRHRSLNWPRVLTIAVSFMLWFVLIFGVLKLLP